MTFGVCVCVGWSNDVILYAIVHRLILVFFLTYSTSIIHFAKNLHLLLYYENLSIAINAEFL